MCCAWSDEAHRGCWFLGVCCVDAGLRVPSPGLPAGSRSLKPDSPKQDGPALDPSRRRSPRTTRLSSAFPGKMRETKNTKIYTSNSTTNVGHSRFDQSRMTDQSFSSLARVRQIGMAEIEVATVKFRRVRRGQLTTKSRSEAARSSGDG